MMNDKRALRRTMLDRRAAQPDKERLSRQIVETLARLPEFVAANALLVYLDVRSEVRTRHFLPQLLGSDQRIVIPWCCGDELRLFEIHAPDDLAAGRFGILEPRNELKEAADRHVDPQDPDLLVVPGVAFDRQGGRLGHGMGYFDKLLARVRQDAWRVGLAFECQLVDQVPREPHDVLMNVLVTEAAVYRCGN